MKDVWTVRMDEDAVRVNRVVGVAADMVAAVDQMNAQARICQRARGCQPGKAHPGNEHIEGHDKGSGVGQSSTRRHRSETFPRAVGLDVTTGQTSAVKNVAATLRPMLVEDAAVIAFIA